MQILNIFHVLVAIGLVGLVLIQKGQGATAGASFGAGASATVFGSRGAGTFLTRATWILAGLFCTISLTMAVVVSRTVGVPDTDLGVVADTPVQQQATEQAEDLPPGAELSVSSDEISDEDVPMFDVESSDTDTDVPSFEAPQDADAIEGSEVRDANPADDSADEGDDGAESGS
jgi:preprotein translocase subunit SecG